MDPFITGIFSGILNKNTRIYNPIFFYGSGDETRQILTELERSYRCRYPAERIFRVDGSGFTKNILSTIIHGGRERYTNRLTRCDLFIFEGAEYLSNSLVQQIFYGVFDKLWEGGKQIVVTASMPPMNIKKLEPRVRTQLEGGIICNVKMEEG